MRRWLAIPVALLLVAADWPQWLGPNRDNSTPMTVKLWTDPPKQLWKVKVPDGHSSPVLVGDTLLLHTAADPGDDPKTVDCLHAFRASTGELLWSTRTPKVDFSSPFGYGPRATPVVHDGRVYTYGVTGTVCCIDLQTGKLLQEPVKTAEKYKAGKLTFGVSSAPLLVDDKLLVMVGGSPNAGIVAFDAQTLAPKWQATSDAPSYAAPIALQLDKVPQAVFLTAAGVVSVNSSTGQEQWRVPFKDLLAESSTTPVKVGDLLIASSVSLGSIGLKLSEKDGKATAEQVWKNPALSCYFSTPVAIDDKHMYMVIAGSIFTKPSVSLRCVEIATGKEVWKEPNFGKYHAALIKTADKKLLSLDDNGVLKLIDPSPAGYKDLCRAKVCGQAWAHPVPANGKLYLRDDTHLICLQLPE